MDFLWGAATSAHQVEGNNTHSDWWDWEHRGFIEGGGISGAACDHWNRMKEDIRLAHELGLNSYRFSIDWAKIEPTEGQWDLAAIEWYRDLISECEKLRIIPMATLHHFTNPLWFAKLGGFASDSAVKYFSRYVDKMSLEFGERIPLWCTINEPVILAIGSYLGKFMPPAEYSPKKVSAACQNMLHCHIVAYQRLHQDKRKRTGPFADRPREVGFAHNVIDFKAERPMHLIDRILRAVFDQFYNRAWLEGTMGRAQHFGIPGLIPRARPIPITKNRIYTDFIGINYYMKSYIRFKPLITTENTPSELPIGVSFARRWDQVSDMGWAIYPKGLRRLLNWVGKYRLPIYITENGIADRSDKMREGYIRQHLHELALATENGLDIRGYYYWSLMDNFEWVKGFGPRFGLLSVNHDTMERTLKPSALAYKRIIQSHYQDGAYLKPQTDRVLSQ